MLNIDGSDTEFRDLDDVSVIGYQSVSSLAIAALMLGLASVAALVGVLLWIVPLAGVITSFVALGQIHRSGELLRGRMMAQVGLALSIIFGVAAPAHLLSTNRILASRAQQVAQQWFDAFAHNEPETAYQLSISYAKRAQLTDRQQLVDYYESTPELRLQIREFVKDPLIHTLLELDGNAQARPYATTDVLVEKDHCQITQTWAVSYPKGDQKETFFVDLKMARNIRPGTNTVDWRILDFATEGNLKVD